MSTRVPPARPRPCCRSRAESRPHPHPAQHPAPDFGPHRLARTPTHTTAERTATQLQGARFRKLRSAGHHRRLLGSGARRSTSESRRAALAPVSCWPCHPNALNKALPPVLPCRQRRCLAVGPCSHHGSHNAPPVAALPPDIAAGSGTLDVARCCRGRRSHAVQADRGRLCEPPGACGLAREWLQVLARWRKAVHQQLLLLRIERENHRLELGAHLMRTRAKTQVWKPANSAVISRARACRKQAHPPAGRRGRSEAADHGMDAADGRATLAVEQRGPPRSCASG